LQKFGEDKSSRLAAGMAFWAFFSVFPLLMALVTVLGYVLSAADRTRVLSHVNSYLPLLDVGGLSALTGSWPALVVGLLAAVWSGLSVITFTENAFNDVWQVPERDQPGLRNRSVRAVLTLFLVGGGLLAATALSGLVVGRDSAVDLGWFGRALGVLLAVVADVGLFVVAFRLLTNRAVSLRDVLPGAVFSGGAFWVLQSLSSVIITRHVSSAQHTYGTFATVITMLWWFYLQAQLTLLGASANVVLKRHRYPRALFTAQTAPANRDVDPGELSAAAGAVPAGNAS
jgi:membrane protein